MIKSRSVGKKKGRKKERTKNKGKLFRRKLLEEKDTRKLL